MTDYTLVEHVETLVVELERHSRVALDTEFMREKTFFAELCLLQVACGKSIFCVDPVGATNLGRFWTAIMRPAWVVHSARQDIEVIYQSAGCMPASLFDTQIAAGLLGLAPQLGYANLVSELFGVEIPKSHTRADWSRRPLSDEVLQYAAEDVEYLLPASEILTERLDKKGRLAWAEEDSAQLLNPALYDVDPALAIERMKGARNLRGRRRAVAAKLAAWRESEALRANRPRQWIVKDSVLLEIAGRLPGSKQELQKIVDLPAGLLRRSGERLLEIVARTDAGDSDYCPPPAPAEGQKQMLKAMQQRVAECAGDLGLAAETVASRKELAAIVVSGRRESRVFEGWRRELIGNQLLGLMSP